MYALQMAGKTQAEIGQALGFSQGTVSREFSRNTRQRGYRFQQAQHTAQARQEQGRHQPRKLTGRVRRTIARKLRAERWSPEQISFWLQAKRGVSLSHEWIYQMIWDNKRTGGDLWQYLRRRGKRYNRRGAQTAGRGVIPHRTDIAERPAIVAAKSRLGDWEGDTIVGSSHGGAAHPCRTQQRVHHHLETDSLDGDGGAPRHGASADTAARPRRYDHLRQRQRVCWAPTDGALPAGAHLLCHALSRVGTRSEREHEWPDSGLLPKGDGLYYHSPGGSQEGKGKRGGARIIHLPLVSRGKVYLLDIFEKNDKVNLTKAERNEMAQIVRVMKGRGA
jgi:hypothetical protein